MYLHKAVYENVGPLKKAYFEFPFFENGNPKPVIIVGENGSGKSTVLSNIVDALFEMAGQKFTNAQQKDDIGINTQYYKAITGVEIHTDSSYMLAYLLFMGEKEYIYTFKSGIIPSDAFTYTCNIEKTSMHGLIERWHV